MIFKWRASNTTIRNLKWPDSWRLHVDTASLKVKEAGRKKERKRERWERTRGEGEEQRCDEGEEGESDRQRLKERDTSK